VGPSSNRRLTVGADGRLVCGWALAPHRLHSSPEWRGAGARGRSLHPSARRVAPGVARWAAPDPMPVAFGQWLTTACGGTAPGGASRSSRPMVSETAGVPLRPGHAVQPGASFTTACIAPAAEPTWMPKLADARHAAPGSRLQPDDHATRRGWTDQEADTNRPLTVHGVKGQRPFRSTRTAGKVKG